MRTSELPRRLPRVPRSAVVGEVPWAVPFPPDDPVYGQEPGSHPPFPLGRLNLRGETRTLRLPADLLIRQRYNPFFSYLAARLVRFVDAASRPPTGAFAPVIAHP